MNRRPCLPRSAVPCSPAMSALPTEFANVTAVAKANIYFDGKVVSHSILLPDGSKKTLGLIYPGNYHFGTDKAERMEIIAGACTVKLDGGETTGAVLTASRNVAEIALRCRPDADSTTRSFQWPRAVAHGWNR